MRIYVGGLGQAVTAEDIERAFSSMGTVGRVEIVPHSDGSRFGFMDLEPNSDKSMVRLFARYNGCIWKGGKLKVEKASEHYMDRLKREWAESAEIAKTDDVQQKTIEKTESWRGSKFMDKEKKQLKIFFPKLRKVKSLPFTGTGRHKYSFQHVNIPPLPVHFCDCEEHSRSHEEAENTDYVSPNDQNGFISEKELNVIKSVMSKLFTKQAGENDMGETEVEEVLYSPSNERNVEPIHDHHLNTQQEMQETDDDDDENFVMNIGSGGVRATLDSIIKGEQRELPAVQDSKRTSKQIGEKKPSKKRQKTESIGTGEAVMNIDNSQLKNGSRVVELLKVPSVEKTKSKPHSPEPQDSPKTQPSVAQVKESPVVDKSGMGASWVQKSSWRDLVGDSTSSSFSISHVLPGTGLKKSDTMRSSDATPAGMDKSRKATTRSHVMSSMALEADPAFCEAKPTERPGDEGAVKKDENVTGKTESGNGEAVVAKSDGVSNTGVTRPVIIGDACTFMRSADSQQQWLKAKSAMSSYLKKKRLASSSSANSSEGKQGRHGN